MVCEKREILFEDGCSEGMEISRAARTKKLLRIICGARIQDKFKPLLKSLVPSPYNHQLRVIKWLPLLYLCLFAVKQGGTELLGKPDRIKAKWREHIKELLNRISHVSLDATQCASVKSYHLWSWFASQTEKGDKSFGIGNWQYVVAEVMLICLTYGEERLNLLQKKWTLCFWKKWS